MRREQSSLYSLGVYTILNLYVLNDTSPKYMFLHIINFITMDFAHKRSSNNGSHYRITLILVLVNCCCCFSLSTCGRLPGDPDPALPPVPHVALDQVVRQGGEDCAAHGQQEQADHVAVVPGGHGYCISCLPQQWPK